MKNWLQKQFRKKSRVYILPTNLGGYLNGLIFLMFLLSIGYANNLLLIFTTFLLAFNLLWLIQTHFHLHRLKFEGLGVFSGHAKTPLNVQVSWRAVPRAPWSWELTLEGDHGDFSVSNSTDGKDKSEGELTPAERGAYHWRYIKVKTQKPFGLYRAWIYFPVDLKTIVYPALLSQVELSLSGQDFEGDLVQDKKGPDDFRGLATYDNDESRKISWKHYARTGDLLIKEGEQMLTPLLELELKIPQNPAYKEQYLSTLATQLVECHRRDVPFLLRMNGAGSGNLADCLKALAIC